MSIRMLVTLVVQMDDEQEAAYLAYTGLEPEPGHRVRDIAGDIREFACVAVTRAFEGADVEGATVTIKER